MNFFNSIPKSINKIHSIICPIYAKGSYVYSSNKRKYLDLTSGIGALSTGHNHPYVVDKVKDQLDKYVHMPQQVFKTHPIQVELTEKILKTVEGTNMDNIFYVNSGSEATENSIKIARKYTGKSNIIAMNRGFHGRTIAALSVTSSNLSCRKGMRPLLSNIFFCNDFTEDSIDNIFNFQSAPEDTAAIILESVQGEGGIRSIDTKFLKYLEKISKENNILLIADEVQCGSMRTGTWWDILGKGINPDMITFGKGIASGYPLAGVMSSSNIMNNIGTSYLGGTYNGNAISSAAASATIDILNDIELQDHVKSLGIYIKLNLKNDKMIKEIRQYGLMIAIELISSNYTKSIVDELRSEGILVLTAGNNNQYIRLLPPLNVSVSEIDFFIQKIKKIFRSYTP
tara:strand:- start:26 stop:1222 length:1197 start_codon:yes stop_codon:yes gene_type:complete